MKKIFLFLFLPILVLSLFQGKRAHTSSSGAPAGHTGGLGENTCLECHGGSLNTTYQNAGVYLAGSNAGFAYKPDSTYTLSAEINQQTGPDYGFQVMAVNGAGVTVGTIIAGAAQQVTNGNNRKYLTHTSPSRTGKWTFQWKAPSVGTGNVTFYWAFFSGPSNSNSKIFTGSTGLTELVALPPITYSFTDSTCNGKPYTFNGRHLTSSGTYKDTLRAAARSGADSIVTLNLIVYKATTGVLNITTTASCPDPGIGWPVRPYFQSGTYVDTVANIHGCDSIITLHVTILPTPSKTIAKTICQGKFVTDANGIVKYSKTGRYTYTIDGAPNCDTVVTLNLTVTPAPVVEIFGRVCSGKTYKFGNKILRQGGIYYDTLKAANGCDSISKLNLSQGISYADTSTISNCPGFSFIWRGRTITAAGTYTDSLKSVEHCDSIKVLVYNVVPKAPKYMSAGICAGKTFAFGSKILTQAGTYSDTTRTTAGCDSITNLTLNNIPTPTDTLRKTVCGGGSFVWRSKTYSLAGTYSDTIRSASTCDTIKVLVLNTGALPPVALSASVCYGKSYQFGGKNLYTGGTYSDTTLTASGCDSITNLTLTINPILRDSVRIVHCAGKSLTWRAKIYTNTGLYSDTTHNVSSCDTIYVLSFMVNPVVPNVINASLCAGKTYQFGNKVISQPGIYSDTLVTAGGCDSIVNLTLTPEPIARDTTFATFCSGLGYTWYHGQVIRKSGFYSDTTHNAGRSWCDTIYTLALTVTPAQVVNKTVGICQGKTYTFGRRILNASGLYADTAKNFNGCDSITNLSLTVNPYLTASKTASICQGKTYSFGSRTLNSSGTYSDTTRTVGGCDSITSLTLTVNPTLQGTLSKNICPNGSFQFGNRTLRAAGTYTDTTRSASGCDSITTLTLGIYNVTPVTIQQGPNDTLFIVSNAATSISWYKNNALITGLGRNPFKIKATGTGNYFASYVDSNGCSNRTATISVTVGVNKDLANRIKVYPNPAKEYLDVEGEFIGTATVKLYNALGQPVILSEIEGNKSRIMLPTLPKGIYLLEIGAGFRKQLEME